MTVEEIEAKAIDALYAARDANCDMHEAARRVTAVVAPLAQALALRKLATGLHPTAGFVTVPALLEIADGLERDA